MARPFFMTGGQSSSTNSQYLVSFKAGKMVQNGSLVSPIKDRKGLIYLQQSEDQLMHFVWKDRTTGQIEEDLIIFPEDAEFLKIQQCKPPGRAFVLKFKTSPRRLFFWSQEAKDDKDDDYVSKINEYINNPPPPRGSGSSGNGGSGSGGLSLEDDVRNILGGEVSTEQLMHVLGSVRNPSALASLLTQYSSNAGERASGSGSGSRSSSTSTPAAPQTPTSTPAVAGSESSSTEPGQLSARLQEAIAAGGASQAMMVDLSTSVNMDLLQPLLTNEDFLARVRETLPPTETPMETPAQIAAEAASTVRSPQFQQALQSFSVAMESGQLGPLIQQFGLGTACVDAANVGSMEMFVKALAEREKASTAGGEDDVASTPARQPGQSAQMKEAAGGAAPKKPSGEPKKDDDDDEPMALD